MIERRRFVRVPATIRVIYSELGKKERREAISCNISAGGIRFPAKEQMMLGSLLLLEIYLPDSKEPLVAKGKVIWQDVLIDSKEGVVDVGIEFVDIDLVATQKITTYILTYLSRKKN